MKGTYNDDTGWLNGLTKGREYQLEEYNESHYLIKANDLGATSTIAKKRFVDIKDDILIIAEKVVGEVNYLGEEIVDVKDSPYKDYDEKDWAMLYIEMYGAIDGAHHKDWVLDQVTRILKGTKVIIKLAKWEDGTEEYRFDLDTPSQDYLDFVTECKAGEDGPDTYSYEEGIAP